ncbi:winged helix-turn-helix transcriptional regulator [Cellulosilyticum sp. I15G10I2]|uniref:winged helix-turn-helix transcriptional regulator n=1 Tax=Cellulosilyticum sp. I15G10I2 TaxID=1892843 RepID=UPI00085C001B|nr:winged helix-turn-helix transcriptional regulator [Cellulosilyticum sp. I15G10I2]
MIKQNIKEDVYEWFKVCLEPYTEGWIKISELADSRGYSASYVRQAMRALEKDGIITRTGNCGGGTYITLLNHNKPMDGQLSL